MTLDLDEREFHIGDPKSLWAGTSLYELYGEAHTPWEWHKPIFERARELGMIPFSTPFDDTAVDFLEKLDVPCYKIASFENTDLPLIRQVAATGKPLIISTGMATVAELDETVRAAREAGCQDLILLKCTSTYPATPDNTNIADHPAPARAVRLRSRPVGPHHGHGRVGGQRGAGRHGDRKAFHAQPRRWRRGQRLLHGARRDGALVVETERAWQALGQCAMARSRRRKGRYSSGGLLYVVKTEGGRCVD